MADEVVARAERQPTSITVDSSEGATFPWAWYFRDLPVGYLELGAGSTAPAPDSDVLILTGAAHDRLGPQLEGYDAREFPVPRLVGARLRRDVARRVVALVHEARDVEPDGRHARVALPAALAGAARSSCRRARRRTSPSSSHLPSPASP